MELDPQEIIFSSFRDPNGYVFLRNKTIYRQINKNYKEDYEHLMNSGLYDALVDYELLIPHQEIDNAYEKHDKAFKVIKPEIVPYISYPYEWCFSQLKNAALATLEIQKKSLEFGMSLKDSSAYNIQFKKGKPILIDTLSFEKFKEGRPWIAYNQFCKHFLAPLALMSYKDVSLNKLLRIYIDGVPLEIASSLLSFRTYLRFSLFTHIHLHSRSQKHFADKTISLKDHKINKISFDGLIDNLQTTIEKLRWSVPDTGWTSYYESTNYLNGSFKQKIKIVDQFLNKVKPETLWDFGSNTGLFSRISSDKGIMTIAFDNDPACVEKNYLDCVRQRETNLLPLVMDLTNPSPGIGWENNERMSILERGPVDAVIALALIHHLAISNNLPFHRIAAFFSKICDWLIIEFVPKSDSQVKRLLANREDIFNEYTQRDFELAFKNYFRVQVSADIVGSERILYLMKKGDST